MKVLFITYPMAFHTPGGGEIQLLAYKKSLEEKGIQVDLFNPWKPNFLDYDIIHYFSCIGGSVHICNFIKNLNIPLVISSSLWIEDNKINEYPMGEIRLQLSLADYVITNSEAECDNLASFLNLPREKFLTVYNGFDPLFFEKVSPTLFREKYKISDDFILNIANIEPRKNQLNLLSSQKESRKKIVLIGHVRNKDYFDLMLEEDENNQIIHIGYLDNSDILLRSAIQACDIFCMPSTLETPGLAALEALAQGAKIAVTKIGSTVEYFGHEAANIQPDSIKSIKDEIEIAKHRIPKDITSFTWNKVTNRLVDIYSKLLSNC